MSCSSFLECLTGSSSPSAQGVPTHYTNLTSFSYFAVNLTMYLFYALLVVWVGYFLVKTVYSLFGAADSAESHEKFRSGLTNAVMAAIGIILILSARFLLNVILGLLGVLDADNPFN